MRKILLPFAMTGLLAMPLVGCDVENSEDTDTDTTNPNDVGDTSVDPDTTPTAEYRAIIVDDSALFQGHRSDGNDPCGTSADGAHGADIDAVGLFQIDNGAQELVGYFDAVAGALGTQCNGTRFKPHSFTDITQAKGTPDATTTNGRFVSLGGGAIIGEFDKGVGLFEDDIVIVYEVGAVQGGTTDAYDVFVATRLDCLTSGDRSSCQVKITGANGAKGETSITLSGF